MVIKRKDGSIYKLVGPNPLMNEQELNPDVILHNFGSHETVEFKDANLDIPELIEIKPVLPKTPELPVEIKIEEKPKEVEIQPAVKPSKIASRLLLPIVGVYDDKTFNCEGIILQNDDFLSVLWTNQELKVGSTVYPKNGEKRWWQITAVQALEHGWKNHAKLSAYQPAILP